MNSITKVRHADRELATITKNFIENLFFAVENTLDEIPNPSSIKAQTSKLEEKIYIDVKKENEKQKKFEE